MTRILGRPQGYAAGVPLKLVIREDVPYRSAELGLSPGVYEATWSAANNRWESGGAELNVVMPRWDREDAIPLGQVSVFISRTDTGAVVGKYVYSPAEWVETGAGVFDLGKGAYTRAWVRTRQIDDLTGSAEGAARRAEAAAQSVTAATLDLSTERQRVKQALADTAQSTAQALEVLGIAPKYVSHSLTRPPVGPDGTRGTWLTEQGRVYGEVVGGVWVETGYGAALSGQPEAAALYARALSTLQAQPADYPRVRARVAAGQPVRVALWGDSRSEGADTFDGVDANYGGPGGALGTRPGGDAYALRLERDLRALFPALEFQNFSLGSRNAAMAQDPGYKALDAEPPNPAQGFKRPWSTAGKSWKDHVRDWQPDLVIFAHDINSAWDASGVDEYHVTPTLALLTEMAGWPTTPDVVLVAGHESTPQTERGGFDPRHVRAAARANREIARARRLPLADAHRLYGLLRYGRDDDTTRTRVVTLANYPGTNWTGDTTKFGVFASEHGRYLVHDAAVRNASVRVGNVRDFRLEVEVNHPSASALGILSFRQDVGAGVEYTLRSYPQGGAFNGGTGGFRLYWRRGGTLTALGGVDAPIPIGASIPLTVDAVGARLHIRANVGGTWLTVYSGLHYPGQYDGAVGFAIDSNEGATWGKLRLLLREPLQARGWSDEAGLMGPLRVNPDATDGNGINHPNGYGHALYYHAAFVGVLAGLQTASRPPSEEVTGTPTLGAGWAWMGGGWQAPTVRRAGSRIEVAGMVARRAGAGVTVMTLPEGFRPRADSFASVHGAPGQIPLQVFAAGRIALLNDASVGEGQWLSVSLTLLA